MFEHGENTEYFLVFQILTSAPLKVGHVIPTPTAQTRPVVTSVDVAEGSLAMDGDAFVR